MKLTESRIKEIIKEEMLAMAERNQVDSNRSQEDETKTLASLKSLCLKKQRGFSNERSQRFRSYANSRNDRPYV